jgi:hypothetical protein
LTISGCFCDRLGPTLPARDPGVAGLGVPGPIEAALPNDDGGPGSGPVLRLGRRRLLSLPADISRSCRAVAWAALCWFVSRCWFSNACCVIFCRLGLTLGLRLVAFAIRAMAACARFGPPGPWFPDTACSGVLAPVVLSEEGGTMLPGDSLSNEGSWGSVEIEPSSCKFFNFMSSRFTCRSNCSVLESVGIHSWRDVPKRRLSRQAQSFLPAKSVSAHIALQ